jgi:hypothetical protein
MQKRRGEEIEGAKRSRGKFYAKAERRGDEIEGR